MGLSCVEQEFDFASTANARGEGGNAGLATLPLGSIMDHKGLWWVNESVAPIKILHAVAAHADTMRISV